LYGQPHANSACQGLGKEDPGAQGSDGDDVKGRVADLDVIADRDMSGLYPPFHGTLEVCLGQPVFGIPHPGLGRSQFRLTGGQFALCLIQISLRSRLLAQKVLQALYRKLLIADQRLDPGNVCLGPIPG
jgi:hypothetical protein